MARVREDIIDILNALATVYLLCWILSVMAYLLVSMSSSSCRISNRFLNWSWNSIFDPNCMLYTHK